MAKAQGLQSMSMQPPDYNPFDPKQGEGVEADRIASIADLRRYVLAGTVNVQPEPEQEKRPAATGLGVELWR